MAIFYKEGAGVEDISPDPHSWPEGRRLANVGEKGGVQGMEEMGSTGVEQKIQSPPLGFRSPPSKMDDKKLLSIGPHNHE